MKKWMLVCIVLTIAVACAKKKSSNPFTLPQPCYIAGSVSYSTCGEIDGIQGWVEEPYEGAMVISVREDQAVDTSVTDSSGRYRVELEPGLYNFLIKTTTTFSDSSLKDVNLLPDQDTTFEDIHLEGLFAAGELMASFQPELTYEQIEELLYQYGCFVIEKIVSWPFDIYLIGIPENSVVSDIFPLLKSDPGVALVSPNFVRCPF
jgi:hypothetical protein